MRVTLRILGSSAALTWMLMLWSGSAWADEVKVPQSPDELAKVIAEAGQPGPEHAKLEPLVGTWSYTCKFWLDPQAPPVETTGTIERKWVLGGRFLEEKVVGTGFDGKSDFEGFGLLGYDTGRKAYTSTWACSMGTGTCNGLGVSDSPNTFTFHTESFCPVLKKIVKGREEIRIESNDRNVMQSYQIQDGKETKLMELVSVRKE